MAIKLPVWGIDVGQCSLKAVKLQPAGEGVEMLAFDVVEHETILSQAGPNTAELIKKAIETFLSRHSLKDSEVVVAVPGQQTLTRFTKMPPVEPKKIPDMVQYEASQQIPFDMDEVVWDYQVFTEEGSPDVEVGIFAIRKELIRNYLLQFTDAGMSPVIVQSTPMASYNGARFEHEVQAGKACILLDMGALATDLIVMEGNRIWARPIPIGGNRFTEALVSAFKISFGKAEKLKRTAAASKHARQIFQAMRPVLADLVNEIQRSIGYYTSTHREAHLSRVIGMGNAFKLPGLQKFLQQNLQIEVERLTSFKKMTVPADRAQEFGENVMSFTVAYGLALQGLGLAAVGSNLLPLEIRRSILWRKKQPWFWAAAASLALGAASLWAGNVIAGGQVARALGGQTDLNPQNVTNVQEAERIISGGGSDPPLLRAAKVAGAAERLKQEFSKVSSQNPGDAAWIGTMANLLENDVLVPRLIDVIHQGFEQASAESLRGVGDSRAYMAEARKTPREQRHELWIERLEMVYDPTNAASQLPGAPGGASGGAGSDPEQQGAGRKTPGWFIRIAGVTTQTENTPKWLSETLLKPLEKLGRQPKRGFYFDQVRLGTATEKIKAGELFSGPDLTAGAGGRESTARGAAAQPSGPSRGRGQVSDSGAVPMGRGRPSVSAGEPVRNPRGGRSTGPQAGGELADSTSAADSWRKKLNECDPLTEEKTDKDWAFAIYIVVAKGDTPQKMIPEEYRQGGKTAETKEEPAQPAEEERRD